MNITLTRPPVQVSPAHDLPALPAAVLELLDLFARDAVDTQSLAAKIALDPALSAKTLRLANSSFYGLARHVSSLGEAVGVLGLRTMRNVVTMAALQNGIPRPACEGFDFETFWRHAIAVAVAAKRLAHETGAEPETAFTAGLLHDMGRLVMVGAHPLLYAQVLAHADGRGHDLAERELQILGTHHAEVGALVAEHWRFPKAIVDAIDGHHDLAPASELTTLVALADQLVHVMETGPRADGPLCTACGQAWRQIGQAPEELPALLGEIERQVSAISLALLH